MCFELVECLVANLHATVVDLIVANVQFARGADDGRDYAIKFFTLRSNFEREAGLYANAALRTIMPAVRTCS